MKKRILDLGVLLLGATAFLTSFESAMHGSGSISVHCTIDGHGVEEVLVGVAASEEDRDNSKYVMPEKDTDAEGNVTFEGLDHGTYYLDAFVTVDDEDYSAEGEVEVGDGAAKITMRLLADE